ncbi:MAG: DNA-binding protein WhiA [Clostridiaceae bacterium]|nr:DNA-binding protein WhiA [Clostridiaceae bacterium]
MSFSMDVKNELSRLEDNNLESKKFLLMGLLRTGLVLRSYKKEKRLVFITENAALSRHLFSLVKEISQNSPGVVMLKTRRFRTHTIYGIDFTKLIRNDTHGMLKSMGISLSPEGDALSYEPIFIKSRTHKRAYIRGCFLATGSISDPDKSYHLEITFANHMLTEEFIDFLKDFDIQARQIMRKGYYLAYLKEGQEIVDFLNVVGAHSSLMDLENIRILKDMRNQVNRIVNCETANLEKTVKAAYRQVENIKYINDHLGLDKLPKSLHDIAFLRLENPDISLTELGRLLTPPLSKSGVNHRLRKLDKIAEDLMKKQN